MNYLLHEGGLSSVPGLSTGLSGPLGQRYSSSSEGEEEGEGEQGGWTGAQPAGQEQSAEEESVLIGCTLISLLQQVRR